MNYPQLPAWAALALAGSLFAVPSIGATNAPANTTLTKKAVVKPAGLTSSTVPTRLVATGLANPIGSQIQLTWIPVPRALGYKIYRDGQLLTGSDHAFFIDFSVAAGETHTYTVTSVGLAGESAPSASATAKVPLGGNKVIYSDALQNGWQSWSWASVNLSGPSTVANKHIIQVMAGPWQAFYLHHTKFSTANYASVSFFVYGGAPAGQKLLVRALRNGVAQTPVPFGPLKSGQWQVVNVSMSDLGVSNVTDMDGIWVQDATGKTQAPFYFGQIVLTPAAATATVAPPAAPTALTATPEWSAHCPVCHGKAMPHITLAWNAVSGADSYTLYRNGVKLQDGLTTPSCTDMSLVSGQSYQYTVAANAAGGASPQSAAATATAPNPPAGQGAFTAPTNLSVQGAWLGAPTDALAWSPVPGAASYNLYQYDVQIAQGITTNSYVIPASLYSSGMSYTVTAVDGMNMESLPSALATALGGHDPVNRPSWMPDAPPVPTHLAAASEWNGGNPRIHLKWHGNGLDYTYSVYRDGQKIASGLWGLNYYDNTVQPGESHVYTVSGVNSPWITLVESNQSAPLTVTALTAAPAPSSQAVQITALRPSDDSVLVSFAPVPGAVDYRVYDTAHPNSVKYSGGALSIELNGLDPAVGADLVVEAVDKPGPFQKMDGVAVPGAMQMDGMHEVIDGQGDPSNIPNILAASAPFHVTCQPMALTGSQAFFDNFRNEKPLVQQPMPAPVGAFYGTPGSYIELANDKWAIRDYGGDLTDSKVFFMENHFMDTLFDGGTPHSNNPMHNNDASTVLMPKATADISGGRVLHATFEVDSHFDSRRWCEVQVAAVGDLLVQPGKVDSIPGFIVPQTASSNSLRWQIQDSFHTVDMFQNIGTPDQPVAQLAQLIDLSFGPKNERGGNAARIRWDGSPLNNGTAQDLDKRHRFDLYLSQAHYRIEENGVIIKDADFPAGMTLPFSKCQVYFVHQLYHTANDRVELINAGVEPYWYNNRPWSDERHWDNMGQEVLPAFPPIK